MKTPMKRTVFNKESRIEDIISTVSSTKIIKV